MSRRHCLGLVARMDRSTEDRTAGISLCSIRPTPSDYVFKRPGNDGKKRVRPRSAKRPRFCSELPPSIQRAQGMPGAGAPAAARVVVVSTRVSHHEYAGNTRHSPRNGFNGFLRALPGDRALLPPSPLRSLLLKSLTPASGRQDHTTSPSASASPVKRASASIASCPYVRDVRETPL
jgi:hypothetical protein